MNTHTLLELTDLLAVINIHAGNWLKIKHNHIGWLLSAISICYFIGRAMSTGFFSQCLGHCISLGIASYGFYKWRNEK